MTFKKIAIIGGGNLGGSIAEGLLESKEIQPDQVWITRRNLDRIAHLKEAGMHTLSDNPEAVKQAELVLLAVKPQKLHEILVEIHPAVQEKKHVLVSLVTGISIREMRETVGHKVQLFRAMPNTAIAIQESMTCIASDYEDPKTTAKLIEFFDLLGKSVVINEELMQAATVMAACGVAYALRFIRAASQGGIEIGFGADIAQLITAQTVKGAAGLLIEHKNHPEQEIDKVTTPQGCTIAGLNEMEHQGFSSSLIKGIMTSFNKIDKIK